MKYAGFLIVLFLFSRMAIAADDISVSGAWINAAPPGVNVLAGYLTIDNNSNSETRLVSAVSEQFGRIEFHSTQMHDGVASMQRHDTITIPAGTSFSFTPGGYHLMLFNPVAPMHDGDVVPVELVFANGTVINTEINVRRGNSGHSH